MREQPILGQRILRGIEFLEGACAVVAEHHEKWDGSGYPRGLRATQIDIKARIFAVADAFDAVVSNRVYRQGKTYMAALEELKTGAGRQFDPEVVAAFERVPPEEWRRVKSKTEGERMKSRDEGGSVRDEGMFAQVEHPPSHPSALIPFLRCDEDQSMKGIEGEIKRLQRLTTKEDWRAVHDA
jgi:hypothetical protein